MAPRRALFLALFPACALLASVPAGADPYPSGAVVLAQPAAPPSGPEARRRSREDLALGEAALDRGDSKRALDLLRESVRLHPGAANYRALGRAYEALGRVHRAVWAYRQSLERSPDAALAAHADALKAAGEREVRADRVRSPKPPNP